MSDPTEIAVQIVEFGKRLYRRNYIGGIEGNLSVRLTDGRIMITPSGVNKGYLFPGDMVITDIKGKKLEGKGEPSSEIKLHIDIYNWRPDITAICHAHPIYATAYSTAGIPLNRPVLPEVVGSLGVIPLATYAPPGSKDLSASLANLIDRYDAFLLESHGVVALGKSLEDAFNKIETVERFAHKLFIADQIGEAKLLSFEETDRLLKIAGRSNIKREIILDIKKSHNSAKEPNDKG